MIHVKEDCVHFKFLKSASFSAIPFNCPYYQHTAQPPSIATASAATVATSLLSTSPQLKHSLHQETRFPPNTIPKDETCESLPKAVQRGKLPLIRRVAVKGSFSALVDQPRKMSERGIQENSFPVIECAKSIVVTVNEGKLGENMGGPW
jgi:hypothetical protein